MKLNRDILHLKVPTLVLPLLFVASVGAAFVGGYYIAVMDATKREVEMAHFTQASSGADRLRLYALLLSQVRSGQLDSAIRVLEYQAYAQSPWAAECLSNQVCALLAAPTQEKESQLRELISAHDTLPFLIKK